MADVHDVAAYVLKQRGAMSAMKLQKLVYYAQAWNLVWNDEPLFPNPIEAWANGPVVRDLFNQHRGRYTVEPPWPKGDAGNLSPMDRGTIDAVLSNYGELTGRQLSFLTHNEDPWLVTRRGLPPTAATDREIPVDVIHDYYDAVDREDEATPVDEIDWDSWELTGEPRR